LLLLLLLLLVNSRRLRRCGVLFDWKSALSYETQKLIVKLAMALQFRLVLKGRRLRCGEAVTGDEAVLNKCLGAMRQRST